MSHGLPETLRSVFPLVRVKVEREVVVLLGSPSPLQTFLQMFLVFYPHLLHLLQYRRHQLKIVFQEPTTMWRWPLPNKRIHHLWPLPLSSNPPPFQLILAQRSIGLWTDLAFQILQPTSLHQQPLLHLMALPSALSNCLLAFQLVWKAPASGGQMMMTIYGVWFSVNCWAFKHVINSKVMYTQESRTLTRDRRSPLRPQSPYWCHQGCGLWDLRKHCIL